MKIKNSQVAITLKFWTDDGKKYTICWLICI